MKTKLKLFLKPSISAQKILRDGNILAKGENPCRLFERVISAIFASEELYGTPKHIVNKMKSNFAQYIIDKKLILGSPLLTNAGRGGRPLASCTVIPVDLNNLIETEQLFKAYHKLNMGSGFNLSRYKNPVQLLFFLNNLSKQEAASGQYERYIGNMGALSVYHPKIKEFIVAKKNIGMKHFNISINIDERFMDAALSGETIRLFDGSLMNASELLDLIAENAHYNGDPGLLYMDRLNKDNPIEAISPYDSTPPCAEMGLALGEICQFGYVNLAKFVKVRGNIIYVNWDDLEAITRILTRVLDNAIEESMSFFPTATTKSVTELKRKIGIGVVGLADMLIIAGMAYDSQTARNFSRDIIDFINYISKTESVVLAVERGSCKAMMNKTNNKYFTEDFISKKYASNPTHSVTSKEWLKLECDIKDRGLRNILTTSLPPSGRSALIVDATNSIEPIFSVFGSNGYLPDSISTFLKRRFSDSQIEKIFEEAKTHGSYQDIAMLNEHEKSVLKTAKEITPENHLAMVSELAGMNGVVDEAASKTVNLPTSATVADVRAIFELSYTLKLKNCSIYRDGSHLNQPNQL